MPNNNHKEKPNFEEWAMSCFALPDKAVQINCVVNALKDAYLQGRSSIEPLSDEALEKKLQDTYPTEVKSRWSYEKGFRDAEARILEGK